MKACLTSKIMRPIFVTGCYRISSSGIFLLCKGEGESAKGALTFAAERSDKSGRLSYKI
jgi:hypothetical protein